MSLFQILMPTIDGLSHALTLLCLCWFFAAKHLQMHLKLYLLFAGLLVFLITTRIHALPLLFLLLIIRPVNPISLLRRGIVFFLSMSIVFCWAIWALLHTADLRIVRPLSTLKIIEHYATHPSQWVDIFYNTLSSQEIWLYYAKTFIGVLGWLRISLPEWYYIYCGIILVALAFLSLPRLKLIDKNAMLESGIFFALAFLSAMMVWNMLLFTWTPFPNDVIGGVQGRYFWIPVCIFAFGLGRTAIFSGSFNLMMAVIGISNLAIIYSVYLNRY
jgi:uncharacterized membrane protein